MRAVPLLFLLCACALPAARPTALDEAEVVLDALHATAARADGAAWFALFAPDARYVGTDASEHWDLAALHAFADPYFARGQGWTYVPRERHLALGPSGDVAWFEERLDNASYGETRGSGVLVRRDGRWLIAQYVLSFPVPNELAPDLVQRVRARGH
jgi:hypothetical protein